jgi:hypothetical protein
MAICSEFKKDKTVQRRCAGSFQAARFFSFAKGIFPLSHDMGKYLASKDHLSCPFKQDFFTFSNIFSTYS